MKLAPVSLFDRLKKKNNTKLNLRDIRYYVQENIGQKKVMSGFRSRSSKLCNLCPSIHSSVGKESAHNARDLGLIPGLGRSPGEGKGSPLQYSGLEKSMDFVVHRIAKSQTRMSDFHFHPT